MTRWGASSSRDGASTGRRPTRNDRSAIRAARLAERTEANVAMARTRVPAAVASEATVDQSMAAAAVTGQAGGML